jgi:hypothetical protein
VEECLRQLTEVHQVVSRRIDDQMLWCTSMPCLLPSDDEIPIGHYNAPPRPTIALRTKKTRKKKTKQNPPPKKKKPHQKKKHNKKNQKKKNPTKQKNTTTPNQHPPNHPTPTKKPSTAKRPSPSIATEADMQTISVSAASTTSSLPAPRHGRPAERETGTRPRLRSDLIRNAALFFD